MLKFIKYSVFCLLLPLVAKTQNNADVFSLKPFAGFNACQIHGDNAAGYKKFGVNAGVIVNAVLTKKTSLDIGFGFTQKGARKNQDVENGDYTFFRVNLNYIEVPILLNYKLNEKYFLTAGPSIAYLINYSEDTEIGNWNGVYPFNPLEFGVNIGLGRTIKDNWQIEVRSGNSFLPVRNYGIAANNIFFPNAVARFFNKGLYNNILSVSVLYQLKLKKKSE
jgi:hypothetical protein